MRLPRPRMMYIGKSQMGSKLEGREGKHSGNTMKPGALTKYSRIFGFHFSQKQEDWARFPVVEYQYMVENRSYIPHSLLLDEKGELQVKRLETLSFWHASYQEVLRHLGLAEKLVQSEFYSEILAIVESYKPQICEAFVKYIKLICEKGDFSFEQFQYYAKEHADSASPWDNKKWGDLLKSPGLLKSAYAECIKWIRDFEQDLAKIMQYATPLILAEFVYAALRARPADYEIMEITNDRIIAKCTKTRDRKAGGVKGLSQIEWPIYGKTQLKREIYQEAFYSLIAEISGCELNAIVMTGANFYKAVIEQRPFAYDLRNAEKLVGMILPFLPILVDLGEPHYPSELAAELYSGVGPTRPGSEIVVAIIIRWLKERGYQVSKLFLGGDNFGMELEINPVQEGYDILFTREDTILGWIIDEQRFGPYSFITDNVKNRWNIPKTWSALTSVQNYQFELRPLQVMVNNDLLKSKSAVRLIDWVCAEPEFNNVDIYSKREIYAKLIETPQLHDKFRDLFSEELQFVKQYVPTHQQENRPTDAHLIVY